MSDTPTETEPHSARVLDDTRNSWWNDDFLQLVARRTGLDQCSRVLDVGAGQGHFGRRIAPLLKGPFALIGVDREPAWVELASKRARSFLARTQLEGTMTYQRASAEELPFEDHAFDAVVCQTLLMHVPDPARALREFARVCKPGGLLLAAEPNNMGALQRLALAEDSDDGGSLEAHLTQVETMLRIFRGKRALGEGDNTLGARLPALFAPYRDAQFFTTDRPFKLAPPYESDDEQMVIERLRERCERGEMGWSRSEARRYWLAGGGDPSGFDRAYDQLVERERRELARIDAGTHAELCAIVHFIAAARTDAARSA